MRRVSQRARCSSWAFTSTAWRGSGTYTLCASAARCTQPCPPAARRRLQLAICRCCHCHTPATAGQCAGQQQPAAMAARAQRGQPTGGQHHGAQRVGDRLVQHRRKVRMRSASRSAAHWRTRCRALRVRASQACTSACSSASSSPSSQALSSFVGKGVPCSHHPSSTGGAPGTAAAARPGTAQHRAARHTRDITVPMGMCITSATSA
jgi:hypothetical protein